MLRLTTIPGQPIPQRDIIGATRLYHSELGIAGPFLDLSGRPASALYDVYKDTVSGELVTEQPPSMEVQITGTPIGGMTGNGGLAAAFDGVLLKGYLTACRSPGAVSGYLISSAVGLALSSPAMVNRVKLTATVDGGFVGSGACGPWELVGANGNNFSVAQTIINGILPPSAGTGPTYVEIQFPNGIPYDHIWFVGYGNGPNAVYIAQVQMWSTLPISARGITTSGGELVNDHAMLALGNSGLTSFAAGQCEYLGQVQIDPTAGQASLTMSYGLDRRVPYWNAKNQAEITLKAGDNGVPLFGHFAYSPATALSYAMSPTGGSGLVRLTFLNGLADQSVPAFYQQLIFQNNLSAATAYWCGIGVDSTNTTSGLWDCTNIDSVGDAIESGLIAHHVVQPFFGSKTLYALEGARGNVAGFWGENNQLLSATFNY